MKASDLSNSNYLEEDDITPPILLTITSQEGREFKNRKGGVDKKCVLGFEETKKTFVCNITNFKHIAKFTGKRESADWIGEKIVLWYNPDIEMAGEIVGGIRVRPPRQTFKEAVKDVETYRDSQEPPVTDDDVPF